MEIGGVYGTQVPVSHRKTQLVMVKVISIEWREESALITVEPAPGEKTPSYRLHNRVWASHLLTREQIDRMKAEAERRSGGAEGVAEQLESLGFKRNSPKGFRVRTSGKNPQIVLGWEAAQQILDMIPALNAADAGTITPADDDPFSGLTADA